MPSVQSRVNGLIIDVPADASGVLRRFKTPGDNELIFAGIKGGGKADDDKKLVIESEASDTSAPPATPDANLV
jgi:hypothetical protein